MDAASECFIRTRREGCQSSASVGGRLLELQVLERLRRCGPHGGFRGASFLLLRIPRKPQQEISMPGTADR
jgi:hypothetical protein